MTLALRNSVRNHHQPKELRQGNQPHNAVTAVKLRFVQLAAVVAPVNHRQTQGLHKVKYFFICFTCVKFSPCFKGCYNAPVAQPPAFRDGTASPELVSAYERYCRHEITQAAAAAELDVHPNTLRRYWQRLARTLHTDLADHVAEVRVGQTVALRHVASEALTAWQDSRGEQVVVHRRETSSGDYRETTTSTSHGNAAYLTAAMKALEDVRKIWGAEAPRAVIVDAQVTATTPQAKLEQIGQRMQELIPAIDAVVIDAEPDPADVDKPSN